MDHRTALQCHAYNIKHNYDLPKKLVSIIFHFNSIYLFINHSNYSDLSHKKNPISNLISYGIVVALVHKMVLVVENYRRKWLVVDFVRKLVVVYHT